MPETREDQFNPNEPAFVLGQIQYSARTAIRDLVRTHGFEEARDLVAGFLIEEMERR